MKAAFLAVIVVVLNLQGSEALLVGVKPGVVDLLKLLNKWVVTVKHAIQRVLNSQYPNQHCKVVNVVPDVHKLQIIGSALRITAKVNLKCPAKVQCILSASVDRSLTKLTGVNIDCPFATDIPVTVENETPTTVANDIRTTAGKAIGEPVE